MKTLDEVIKNLEDGTEHLSAILISKDTWNDALHYLKEYRKLDSLDAVAFPEDDNPAMTWDELQTMKGKPVWIEHLCGVLRWGIIDDLFHDRKEEKTKIRFGTRYGFLEWDKDDIGTRWQAFRKERS